MAKLPDELIGEILLRLPVKTLLRFRCVSKQWCALIDTNDFIKQHLSHSLVTKTSHKLIFQNTNLYSLRLVSPKIVLKLVQPISPNQPAVELLGSCNGLLCLSYGLVDDLIIIWNPNTRKHVKLPAIDPSDASLTYEGLASPEYILVFGFGYDSICDDYKVVMLLQFFPDDDIGFVSETNVYSLRSGLWRIIDDEPDCLIRNTQGPGALVCGAIHWIATNVSDHEFYFRLVAAFDVVTEEYTTVALPDFPFDGVATLFVSELGGFLSIVSEHVEISGVGVWVMKDYGVKESWTKLLILSNLEICRTIEEMIPLAYSESDDELALLLNSKELLFYNLQKRTIKFVDIHCGHAYFNPPMICLESLISLGGKAEKDEKQGGENEQVKVVQLIMYLFQYLYRFISFIETAYSPKKMFTSRKLF